MADGDRDKSHLLSDVVGAPEALVICPECDAALSGRNYEAHLRRVHQLYLFRGTRRPFDATFVVLLQALLRSSPDPEAWQLLTSIVAEQHGSRTPVFLAFTLGAALGRLDDKARHDVIPALADVLAVARPLALAAALAAESEPVPRLLALALIARLKPPFEPVLGPLRALLADQKLPGSAQVEALAAILRAGADRKVVSPLLKVFVRGRGKARAIERLRQIEKKAGGRVPVVAELCTRLEDRLRLTCPRCSVEMRRPEMLRHLWNEHRLFLHGRRVRDAWWAIETWLDYTRTNPNPEAIERCLQMGHYLDGEEGLARVQRMLLARGLAEPETHTATLREAQDQHASCCPWCYAFVPVPRAVPPLTLNYRPDRLSGGGYSVEVGARGLRTVLRIDTPKGSIYRGSDPGQVLTQNGALLLLAGPFVLLAVLWAFGLMGNFVPPLGPALILLAFALLLGGLAHSWWRRTATTGEYVLRCAWRLLVPRLHDGAFSLEDSAFLAGLAQLTLDEGRADLGAELVAMLLRRTEAAVVEGRGATDHLALLQRLEIEAAVLAGKDPVPLTADELARCFEGRLSLAFADRLLTDWQTSWWTRGNLVRLRIMLCDRAFEAGFEVCNLLDAGQTAPALGDVLRTDDLRGLSALRLLWSLRPTRPWDRCGPAETVYELAEEPEYSDFLGENPDLLLRQEDSRWRLVADGTGTGMEPVEVLFRVGGVWLQGCRFTEPPRVVEVISKSLSDEMVMGPYHFRSHDELDELARRMERWFRYAFHEFLPSLPQVQTWQSPDREAILRAWGAVPCPECQRYLLARAGEVGIALDEARPA